MATRDLSDPHEEDVAAALPGGKVRPGSGAGWRKGDVRAARELVSCKATEKLSISVKRSDWGEVENVAYELGLHPVMAYRIARPLHRHGDLDLIAIPLERYAELREKEDALERHLGRGAGGAAPSAGGGPAPV